MPERSDPALKVPVAGGGGGAPGVIPGLTNDQVDALVEVVNIGFGKASSLLAKLVDSFVKMRVPRVEHVEIKRLPLRLEELAGGSRPFHVVRQAFRPHFRGESLFVVDDDALGVLHELLKLPPEALSERDKQDGLLEVANILCGALVGKLSEVIGTSSTFSAPQLLLYREPVSKLLVEISEENDVCLLIHTGFTVERMPQFNGWILILLSRACLDWLARSLDRYASGGIP